MSDKESNSQKEETQQEGKDENGKEEVKTRRWTTRRTSFVPRTNLTYSELVAERQEQQKKKDVSCDMSQYSKPKECVKEGNIEFCTVSREAKKNWEKRWFVLTNQELLYFKSKKSDTPLGVILLTGSTIEAADEKGKKNCFSLNAPTTFTPDMISKEQKYVLVTESPNDLKGWYDALKKTIKAIPSTNEKASSSASSTPRVSISSDPRNSGESWFDKTTTASLPLQGSGEVATNGPEGEHHDPKAPKSLRGSTEKSKRSSLKLKREKGEHSSVPPSPGSTTPRQSSGSLSRPVTPPKKFPILFYNPIFGDCNALRLFCLENSLDVEQTYVHQSWILSTLSGKDTSGVGITFGSKSFSPLFIQRNPSRVLPAFVTRKAVITDSVDILRRLHKKFKMSEELYPKEGKLRDKIDDMFDKWGIQTLVADLVKTCFYDRVDNPSASSQQYKVNSIQKELIKVLARLDTELKTHSFVAGDSLTLADYFLFGQLNWLKFLKFDLTKMIYLKKWFGEMESRQSWKSFQPEVDEHRKEFSFL